MASNPSKQPVAGSVGERWAMMTRVAEIILNGPRAVMPSSDPSGLQTWFDPLARVMVKPLPLATNESKSLYSVAACAKRDLRSAVLLRCCSWDAKADRDACKDGAILRPSVAVRYLNPLGADLDELDLCVRAIDRSCRSFGFAEEGLGQTGIGVAEPEAKPDSSVDVSGDRFLRLQRTTRHSFVELAWIESATESRELTQAIHRTWRLLEEIESRPVASIPTGLIERYDVQPSNFAEFLSHGTRAASEGPGFVDYQLG